MYRVKYKTLKHNGILHGYRSGLEELNQEWLKKFNLDSKRLYECMKISYTIPESVHTYTPDFVLPNGVIVETKGRFTKADRDKHLLVKNQHPELDIRFVFSNAKTKIRKGSKTTYAKWCEKYGFLYAEKLIPIEWIYYKKG